MPQYYENVQKAMGVPVAESSTMSAAIMLWDLMYTNRAPWLNEEIKTLSLPAGICSEIATAVTMESRIELNAGDRMTEAIGKGFHQVIGDLSDIVELMSAGGGIVLKPYVSGDHVEVDYVRSGNVFPVAFDSGKEMTAAIFPEFIHKGKYTYTRLEYHEFNEADGTYKIINKAFKGRKTAVRANDVSNLGDEIRLADVDQWADLEPEVILENATMPLFVYLRVPIQNNLEPDSPLGVSIYARAVDNIQQADEKWGATVWEYKSKETAIQAGREFFKTNLNTGEPILPKGKERLYTDLGDVASRDGTPFFNVYSPEIRDESFYRGFNRDLQRVEFSCRLSYGTLSDPQSIDKTATEIKMSKQRFYSIVKKYQEDTLRSGLQRLAEAMAIMADLGDLAPIEEVEVMADFDDSVVVDKDSERMADRADVAAGIMQPWEYRMKHYRETEEQAKAMIQTAPDMVF